MSGSLLNAPGVCSPGAAGQEDEAQSGEGQKDSLKAAAAAVKALLFTGGSYWPLNVTPGATQTRSTVPVK